MNQVRVLSKEEIAQKAPMGATRLRYALSAIGRTDLMSVAPPREGFPQMRYITLDAYRSLWPEPDKHVFKGLGTKGYDTVYAHEVQEVVFNGKLIKAINDKLKEIHLAKNPPPTLA
jgi:hypothetical protein